MCSESDPQVPVFAHSLGLSAARLRAPLLLLSVHGLSSLLLCTEALNADLLSTQTRLPAARLIHSHTINTKSTQCARLQTGLQNSV